ncbi:MAG: hypothetical protein ACPL7E_02925, partial [bacterium]
MKKRGNSLFFCYFLIILCKVVFPMHTREDVLRLLNDEFHIRLYRNTYNNLVDRLQKTGYLPESLTGAYGGEFPRTIGPYVFFLLENADFERAKKALKYVIDATILARMNRIPHVIGPEYEEMEPLPDAYNPGQPL